MAGGDLRRANELSSEIDPDKQIVLNKTFKTRHFFIRDKNTFSLYLHFWNPDFAILSTFCFAILPILACVAPGSRDKRVFNTFKPHWAEKTENIRKQILGCFKNIRKQILDWFENTLKQILVWFKNTLKQTLGWCWRTRTTVTVETQCETILLGKVVMPAKDKLAGEKDKVRWEDRSLSNLYCEIYNCKSLAE